MHSALDEGPTKKIQIQAAYDTDDNSHVTETEWLVDGGFAQV
jgi:hypothetical protein